MCLLDYPIPPKWAGKKLAPLSEPGVFWLVAITRLGAAQVSTPSAIGQDGDILHFAADVSALDTLRHRLEHGEDTTDARCHRGRRKRRARSSPTTSAAADHEVMLIEQQPAVVKRAQQPATASTGTSPTAARSTRCAQPVSTRCDVVVAATGDDEDNLVVSLLAKQEFAVPRVIARVNHPKNEWLFNENWGVDLSVSTPHLITALVEEAVTVGRLVRILQFEGGQARLVEVTLADDSPVDRPGDRRARRPPQRHRSSPSSATSTW